MQNKEDLITLYKKIITDDISKIQELTKEMLRETNELEGLKTEVKLLNALAVSLLESQNFIFPEKLGIEKSGTTNSNVEKINTKYVFQMIQAVENTYSEATLVQENIAIIMQETKAPIFSSAYSAVSSLFAQLFSKLKRLSTHLWQIISKYCRLKRWSAQGSLNANGFLGLSGSIQIQLTFEP